LTRARARWESEPDSESDGVCPSCGARAMHRFCGECGERRAGEDDLSVRGFLVRAVHTVTNTDSNVVRTFRALVFRPGLLTAEYFDGRRRPYLQPVQLFLVANLIFFVVHTIFPVNVFTTTLSDHLQHHPYSPLIREMSGPGGMTFGEMLSDPEVFSPYAQTFQAVTNGLAKTLVIVMVPIFAMLTFTLFHSRAPFLVQHLVFGLHFYAFMMLVTSVMALVGVAAYRLGAHAVSWEIVDSIWSLALVMVSISYLSGALRRGFGSSRLGAVVGAVVLAVAYLPVLWVYRLILFFLTVAAI